MNRVYSLVWNRALHSVQVASELATSAGGGNAERASGASVGRRHPLALACVAALALGAFALPAWSASACQPSATLLNGGTGTTGANGTSNSPNGTAGADGTALGTDSYCLAAGTASAGGAGGAGGAGATGGPGSPGPSGAPGDDGGIGGTGGTGGAGGIGGAGGTGISATAAGAMLTVFGNVSGGDGGTGGTGGTGGVGGIGGPGGTYVGGVPTSGGQGGTGGTGGIGGVGGAGGAGISGIGLTLDNGGSIQGGNGGSGGSGGDGGAGGPGGGSGPGHYGEGHPGFGGMPGLPGSFGNAGAGGAGVVVSGYSVVTTSGSVVGGIGGANLKPAVNGAAGGVGGMGVSISAGSTLTASGAIVGGAGGAGGTYATGASGGAGVESLGSSTTISASGSITGGAGHAGYYSANNNIFGAVGGSGGAGMVASAGSTITNFGVISGGAGGSGSAGAYAGNGGHGGAGVTAGGGSSVVTSGRISGGAGGIGGAIVNPLNLRGAHVGADGTSGDAVDFSGGGNTLTLESGYLFSGNVISTSGTTNGGDTLALGGSTDASFALGGIGSEFQGFNQFDKTGTSTWTVTGGGTGVAPWNLQDGTLIVGTASTTASLAGPVTVESGAILGGYGSVGATTVAGGTLAPGSATKLGTAGTFGTLTINGDLALQNGSVIDLNLGTPAANNPATTPGSGDHINVTGGLTMSGTTLNVGNINNSIGPGLYNIITYASGPTVTSGLSVATSAPADQNYSIQYTTGQVNLIDAFNTLAYWSTTAGSFGGKGTWTAASKTWTDSTGTAPLSAMTPVPGFAEFEGTPGTVTVDSSAASIDVTGMQFFVPGYSVVGKTANDAVTLVDDSSGIAPVINVGDGTSASATTNTTISAVLTGTDGFTKTDYGTLVLSGDNTYTGDTTVNGGTLEVASGGSLGTGVATVHGNAGYNSTLTVDSRATLANHIVLNSSATSMDDCTASSTCATLNNAGMLNDDTDESTVEAGSGYTVVNNAGTISGRSYAVTLNHGGAVTSAAAAVVTAGDVGVAIEGGAGAVNNAGSIQGVVTGVSIDAGGALTNASTGTIASAGTGAYFAAGGSAVNSGVISASNNALGHALFGVDAIGVNGALGVISNTEGGVVRGVDAGIQLLQGGSVTNDATSTIEATGTVRGDCATAGDCAIFAASASDGAGMGGALTLNNAGSIIGNVQMDPTAANATTLKAGGSITGDLDIGTNIASTLTLDGDAGTSQLYSQAVTGATTFDGALTKSGDGTWIIDSDDLSTVSGTTIDAGGALQIGNGGATGSIGNGGIANNGALVFERNDALVFAGAISGSGTLTQAGNGTLTLDGANTYGGLTDVKAGTLLAGDATHATASIAGDTQVGNGATLSGFGTVGAGSATTSTEIQTGGVLSPGAGSGSVGTLNVGGDLTLDQGSVLDVDLGAPGTPNAFTNFGSSDSVNVAGTLTFKGGSTLNLANAGGMGPGLYNLASYGTLATTGCSFSGGTACMTLGTLPSGTQASYFTLVNNAAGQQIDLYNTAGQALNIWAPNGAANLGGTGTWSTTSATWTSTNGDGPSVMIPQPGFAIFQGTPGMMTINDSAGQVSATGLQFAVDGYTLTGDPLKLLDDSAGNAPVIEVGDGSSNSTNMTATISNELDVGDGFTKTGAGTLVFTGSNAVLNPPGGGIPSIAVNAGTLQVGNGLPAGFGGVLLGNASMAPGTQLVVDDGSFAGGGTTASAAAVSGQGFSVETRTSAAGSNGSAILGFAFSGAAAGAGSAISGSGFTATFTGNTIVAGAGGAAGAYGGTGAAAIKGSGFNVVNNSTLGAATSGGVTPPLRYGITGGTGSYSGAVGIGGGAGVEGSDFTAANSGGIYGGTGSSNGKLGTTGGTGIGGAAFALTNSGMITGGSGGKAATDEMGSAGVGGAGVSGSGFTATNTGTITGGAGGDLLGAGYGATNGVGGAGVSGSGFTVANSGTIAGGAGGQMLMLGTGNAATIGLGGVGVSSLGGATVINEGVIDGGLSGDGTQQSAAIHFTGGGNTLELVAGHPGTFNGAIVVTSATGDPADTLDLGGDTGNDTFDVGQLASGGKFGGFNAEIKSGASTWTLTGTGSSSENWTIEGGTLNGDATAFQGNLTFAPAAGDTASVAFNQGSGNANGAADGTFAGVISGDGSVTKEGNGTLTLSGANTFVGGVNVDAGTLAVSSDANLGAATNAVTLNGGTLENTAAFTMAHGITLAGAGTVQTDADLTDSGVISGSGAFIKTGDGALILTGANTWTGGTMISAGTLQVGSGGTSGALGSGAIVDNGTLVFDRSDAVALPAGLTGTGALIQQGSGTFIVNGDDSGFAGTTTVQAGTATVGDDSHAGASLGGMVNIAKGATLTGIGTLGGLDLSGALSPGGSIGTLHVTGDTTFESGSTFNVEADPNGTADQLAVGGTTTIKGGSVMALTQPGNWAPSTAYTIITSGGGVSGQFAGVSDDQAFLTPTLAYGANAVTLSLARNDINFATVATTPNEKGVANGIDTLGFGNPLYDAVVKLTATDARNAFDQTSGEYHASQQAARIDDSRFVREAMNQRLRNGDADAEAARQGDSNVTAWAHAWGHWGTIDSDANAAKLSDNGDGLLIGADMPVGTRARIGITGGASRNTLSVHDRASWGKLTSQWLGGFAGYDAGAFGIRGGIAYAWDQVPSNREVNFPGYSDRLSGNATGDTLTGFVEGSWTFHFQNASVSPFLDLAHTEVETGASTEAGGAAALHAYSSSENVSFSTLGVRGEVGFANHLNLHGELGWQRAFGDTAPERNLQFASGGPVFTTYGVPIAKDAGLGRIGIGWQHGNVAVSADYEGLSGGGMKDQAAKLSVSVTF